MARTTVTPQTLSLISTTPTYNAATATDGDAFLNNGKTFIHVKNTNASTRTLTIQAPAKMAGVSLTAPTYTIAALTGDHMIGPFDMTAFNQSDGKVYLDWSAVVNVTFAVISLP